MTITKPVRAYQEEGIQQIGNELQKLPSDKRRVMLAMGTGSGKTRTIAELIRRAAEKGSRVIFAADRLVLVKQASEVLDEVLPKTVGILQSQNERLDPMKQVQVASIQTLDSWVRTGKMKDMNVDLVIYDEADVQYKVRDRMAEAFPEATVIGLSATPTSRGLGLFYQSIVQPISVPELIRSGYLSPVTVYGPSAPDMKGVKLDNKGDYDVKQAAKRYTNVLVGDMVQKWKELGKGKPTLMFCSTCEQSKIMVEKFCDAGVKAAHVDGYDKPADQEQTEETLERYRRGELEIVSSVALLARGYDAPWTECLIIARPTKSLALWLQMAGRVMRTHPGKERGIILDHSGNWQVHGTPDELIEFELDKGEKKPKDVDKRDKSDPLPVPCPKCATIKPAGVRKCPTCGEEPSTYSEIVNIEGELVEIKSAVPMSDEEKKAREKAVREEKKRAREYDWSKAPKVTKQSWWSQLKQMQADKGWSDGRTSNMYRSRFKVWPRGLSDERKAVGPHVAKFVRGQNVKYAKSLEAKKRKECQEKETQREPS